MSTRKLHPDWPAADLAAAHTWDRPDPVSDLASALTEHPNIATATFPSQPTEGFQLADIDHIARYHVSYHGDTWTPTGDEGGTELDLYVTGVLTDGRWFAIVAGNDYTGWGCQDFSDIRIGDTEDAVVQYGLDEEGRRLLGYAERA